MDFIQAFEAVQTLPTATIDRTGGIASFWENVTWFDIVVVVIALVGIVLTVFYGVKSSRLQKQLKKLDWHDIELAARKLTKKMRKDKFTPDLVFTPGLRGATFANLVQPLAYDIPVFVGLTCPKPLKKKRGDIPGHVYVETSKWVVEIPELLFSYADKKILILDDFVGSGEFMINAVRLLKEKGFNPRNIKTMAIIVSEMAEVSNKATDYYWRVSKESDFFFPWAEAQ